MSVFIFEIYFAVIFFAAFFMLPMPSPWFTLSALVVFTRLFFISTGWRVGLLTVSMKTAEFTAARTLIIAFSIGLLASRALSSAFARIVQRSMLSIPSLGMIPSKSISVFCETAAEFFSASMASARWFPVENAFFVASSLP